MAAAAQLAVAAVLTPCLQIRTTLPAAAAASSVPATLNQASLPQKAVTCTAAVERLLAPSDAHAHEAEPAQAPAPSLPSMWKEVQGAGDWSGMVWPLHPLLRAEIVRYGELVVACYRALDLDPNSRRYLKCNHGKKRMLQAAGMADAGYVVTKYIYAAADVAMPLPMGAVFPVSRNSRWIGYVAVASDGESARLGRRDILVSFRGTVTGSEWLANFMSALAPARFDPAEPRLDVRVESGFLSLYTSDHGGAGTKFTAGSCRNQLLSEVSRLIAKHRHEEISITLAGHSMGSSLALLLGYDLAELGINRGGADGHAVPITVFSFAGPRVGNLEFKQRCDELGVKVLRVVNVNDPVTKMPGVVFNEGARVLSIAGGRHQHELPWSKACYTHVGVEVALDFFDVSDPVCVHDLQAYLEHLRECPKVVVSPMAKCGEEYVVGGVASISSVFESWWWQMAAIRASQWLQALGL